MFKMNTPPFSGPKFRQSLKVLTSNFLLKMVESNSKYENFELLGRVPAPPNPDYVNYEMPLSKLSKYIDILDLEWLKDNTGDFVISKSTNRTLDISVRKMDNLPKYNYYVDESFPHAYEFVDSMYGKSLTTIPWNIEHTLSDMDLSKSCGAILVAAGYRTKADALMAGFLEDICDESVMENRPIWKACGKVELRSRQKYVLDESQRTFIIEPLESLFHRKRLFGQQNVNMKETGWSSYGFNPYEGGVDRLGQRLSRFRRKIMWDAVKWDRLVPMMREICSLRTTHLIDEDDPFLQWVVESLCESVVLLPNGDLVFKSWGNNSGSGTTTGDNILGMNLIIAHAIYRLYAKYALKIPTMKEILVEWFFGTFGDDVVGAFNFEYGTSDQDILDMFTSTFDLYGIKLDPIKLTTDVEELDFLGFKFKLFEDHYIPKYDLGRLLASFYKDCEKTTLAGEFSKMVSLMLMSAGHGESTFDRIRSIVSDVLTNCRAKELDQYRLYLLPTFRETINWYLGYEGQFSGFLNFFKEEIYCTTK